MGRLFVEPVDPLQEPPDREGVGLGRVLGDPADQAMPVASQ